MDLEVIRIGSTVTRAGNIILTLGEGKSVKKGLFGDTKTAWDKKYQYALANESSSGVSVGDVVPVDMEQFVIASHESANDQGELIETNWIHLREDQQ